MRIRTLEDLNDSLEFFGPGARHDKRSKEIALSALNSLSVTMVEGFWHLVSHCGTDMFVLLKFDSKKIAQHFDEALVGDLLNAARCPCKQLDEYKFNPNATIARSKFFTSNIWPRHQF